MKKHSRKSRLMGSQGFTLIELLIYMLVVGILMTMVMVSFTGTLRRSVQQSGIAETALESTVGLDLLRTDLEHAGFGLPWEFENIINYNEPIPLNDSPGNVPRAVASLDSSILSLNNSDYLVIKGSNVALMESAQKWGTVGRTAAPASVINVQSKANETFDPTDWVIVIRPQSSPGNYRQLVMNGGGYSVQPTAAGLANYAPPPTPSDPDGIKLLLYGIDDANTARRPFNRVDYFINNVSTAHCAPNTGTLVKAQLSQADDTFIDFPIIDCVADFQVAYYLDTTDDGGWDTVVEANGLDGLNPEEIRNRLKMVKYYVLLHEGGLDRAYSRPNNLVNVGEVAADGVTLTAGRVFDLALTIGGNWANYRWRVESASISMKNLK